MSNWKIGDKAVCIDDSRMKGTNHPSELIINAIYTVKFVDIDSQGIFLLLTEVLGEFNSNRFRKLSDISSELSSEILEKITEEIKEPELV